ncbi:ABC1 kinase family protein [Actinacidiphila acidipaludis]|uniref:AarF/ABC1/UbiB kinase family protein n=1 Tax=Actinacidiphila acidipaludis TaxID=2873382 RepID=A0ABS7Q2Q4_9ACTN|nr:AarF/UbiB family protein [Streptomyces acidipaludis]MBY8877417.1 AarF/ABC1/UbiB kinase family protein [Streptomyces acidipaludis]
MKAAEFVSASLVLVLFVTAFAVGARRLLGVRTGALRTLFTGFVGIGGLAVFSLVMQRPEQRGVLTGVQVGSSLLVAMGFLALSEVVVPSGSARPTVWLRSLRSRVVRSRRYSHISSIVIRHGLRPYLHGRDRRSPGYGSRGDRLARPLRLALEEAGATFVKLGQMLSTRDDLLPPAFVAELSRLQSQVTPAPWPEVAAVLHEAYGRPVAEVFAHFDEVPLAAASVAQVHLARLQCGEPVVVKVQRPGIRQVVERDLDIICRLAGTLEERTHWAASLGMADLAEGFARSMHEELDFRVEAKNLATIGNAWARRPKDPFVRLPSVHEPLSGERVLVLERLPGRPLCSAGALLEDPGLDRAELARGLLANMLRQIMADGTFHADPHQGNVLLLDDGTVGLVDFGSVGRVDSRLRAALLRLIALVRLGNATALCDALLEVVDRPEDLDEQALERAVGRFMALHFAPGSTPDSQVFVALFRMVAAHGLKIPPEIAAVFRALATLEGTLTRISPGFDMVAESQDLVAEQLVGGGAAAARATLGAELAGAVSVLRRLPRRLDRITGALEQGRLFVGVRMFADPRDRQYVRSLVHDVLLTLLGATTGVMGTVLLNVGRGPMVTPAISFCAFLGYHLLLVSAVLILRVLFSVSRPRRQ